MSMVPSAITWITVHSVFYRYERMSDDLITVRMTSTHDIYYYDYVVISVLWLTVYYQLPWLLHDLYLHGYHPDVIIPR